MTDNGGYSSHETKLALDWILNDYTETPGQLAELLAENADNSSYELGKALKEFVWDEMLGHVPTTGLAFDFLDTCMREVNWIELGESLLEQIEY